MAILETLLAKQGKSVSDLHRNSTTARAIRKKGVAKSPDLERIKELPRRTWEDEPETAEAVELLTEWLRVPGGQQRLFPEQAIALKELHDFGGCFAPIPVGGGKSILGYLSPTVVGALRPLILMPAKLVREKEGKEVREMRRHWRIPRRYNVQSYEVLGRVSGAEILDRYQPDLVVCDEVHRLKNPKAAVTRRVKRYMRDNPETRFVGMSGTMTRRSLKDYEHIARWCLKDLSPLPMNHVQLQDWADALDAKVQAGRRLRPGALLELATDADMRAAQDETSQARLGYQRRLIETPGVVAPSKSDLACSLSITSHVIDADVPEVEDAMQTLRDEWVTPDGWEIAEAPVKWQHARDLSIGFYHRYNPRPPEEWLTAKKAWKRFVREILKLNRQGLDSELEVANAAARGKIESESYLHWRAIRGTFTPKTEAVWIDDTVIDFAVDWVRKNRGVVWTQHTTVGTRIAERAGVPFFSAGGRATRGGEYIQSYRGRACVASIPANSEGRNLQDRWSKALVVEPPPSGSGFEQLLGRLHRNGQEADEVIYEVVIACREHWAGLMQAREDARYVAETKGFSQKILLADFDLPDEQAILHKRGPRWAD